MRTSPLRKLTDADIDVLVERIGRCVPQRKVAAELGIAQSNVSRLQHRPDVAARVRVVREREAARVRQQRKHDREKTQREADAIDPAKLAERLTCHPADSDTRRFVKVLRRDLDTGAMIDTGTRELVRKHGRWYRVTATCSLVAAKRSDFEGKVPANFEVEPAFGPPGFPRPALGTYDPVTRVRLPVGHPMNRCSVEQTCSVKNGPELDAALEAGAVRV